VSLHGPFRDGRSRYSGARLVQLSVGGALTDGYCFGVDVCCDCNSAAAFDKHCEELLSLLKKAHAEQGGQLGVGSHAQ
jgi:hypothetical protein